MHEGSIKMIEGKILEDGTMELDTEDLSSVHKQADELVKFISEKLGSEVEVIKRKPKVSVNVERQSLKI